ncbi:peptidase s13 d-ala-d-ala carboxypeptidase c [Leptolyngbya sp. Heron Island J]|uniref:D-alanyl-D-alanine carboxypeptidase n=1 Tax=Leptolyngbya sp. Heron Island J TaxID=1385935 RepID=UPI0003B9E258|nr:D-alanyl-D-alanine carboxypeptidase [Leptolyngbya sp. Heron Island J]ESA32834.1 peptidase s13 d-ala-d-ala carboxypeptidase c [Leptolyngbya sp. Heron Island J]
MNWLFSLAFISALIGPRPWQPIASANLADVDIRPTWESPWLQQQLAADPAAETILDNYLADLSNLGFSTDQQSVAVDAGRYPVARHQESRRLPAASLTKVATTLAALETYNIDHQFETFVGWQGTITNGTLQGDLIIKGAYDPLFIWEEGIALGNTLQQLGIQQVTGNLVVIDRFVMNFNTNPLESGELLKQAMNSATWGWAVEQQYVTLPAGTPRPTLQIQGSVKLASSATVLNQASGWLVRHKSLPLALILKAMNIYSNNVMADMVADLSGGPANIVKIAEQVGVTPGEISLVNGSGLGEDNQLSARAVIVLMQAIQTRLQTKNLNFADLFPVAGTDIGTLIDRNLPTNASVKTGSLAVVSALAGALPTEEKGTVWFAIINYGSGLETLRGHQDRLLASLENQWGKASQVPQQIKATVQFNKNPYRLGDPKRNEVIEAPTAQSQ